MLLMRRAYLRLDGYFVPSGLPRQSRPWRLRSAWSSACRARALINDCHPCARQNAARASPIRLRAHACACPGISRNGRIATEYHQTVSFLYRHNHLDGSKHFYLEQSRQFNLDTSTRSHHLDTIPYHCYLDDMSHTPRNTIQTYIALNAAEYRALRKLAFDLDISLAELLARLAKKELANHGLTPQSQ